MDAPQRRIVREAPLGEVERGVAKGRRAHGGALEEDGVAVDEETEPVVGRVAAKVGVERCRLEAVVAWWFELLLMMMMMMISWLGLG